MSPLLFVLSFLASVSSLPPSQVCKRLWWGVGGTFWSCFKLHHWLHELQEGWLPMCFTFFFKNSCNSSKVNHYFRFSFRSKLPHGWTSAVASTSSLRKKVHGCICQNICTCICLKVRVCPNNFFTLCIYNYISAIQLAILDVDSFLQKLKWSHIK